MIRWWRRRATEDTTEYVVEIKVETSRRGWRAETTVHQPAEGGFGLTGPSLWRPTEHWARRAIRERVAWRYGVIPGKLTIEWLR